MKHIEQPLTGKKIALIVEKEYIPKEIKTYKESFTKLGAEVDIASRLWGNTDLSFISNPANKEDHIEEIDVTIDIEDIRTNIDQYAAIIMAANYTSVRLRWIDEQLDLPADENVNGNSGRHAPIVKLFHEAMMRPKLIKGFPCHALWVLSPIPEFLAGRKVTCNNVMLSDVYNAGGIYIDSETGVYVDNEIVTSNSGVDDKVLDQFVNSMKDQIIAAETGSLNPFLNSFTEGKAESVQLPNPLHRRKILMLISEWGYWGEELIGPLEEFDKAGYETDFITPNGKRPNAILVSKDSGYIDPPLGRSVTSPEMANKVKEIDDPSTEQGQRLESPLSLKDLFPERPYWSSPQFVRQMEIYNQQLVAAEKHVDQYDALIIVGGSGPIVDLANNQRVHDLILSFYKANKPIAAECYGVAALAFARSIENRKSIIWGKNVTGHCLEYDYKDGTGFMKDKDVFLDFNMGTPPYPLEYILRDATGPEGSFIGNFGHPTSVIVDYPFITGRSTPDSYLTGQKLIEVLDANPALKRWGW